MRFWLAVLAVTLAVVLAATFAAGWRVSREPKPTHAHTYQECLAKSYGDAPLCVVENDGVTVQRTDPTG